VNDQAGRLVNYGQVFVLINEREGDGRGLDSAGRLVLRDPNRYALASRQKSRCAGGLSFNRDELVGDQPRCLGPGYPHLIRQEAVQALGLRSQYSEL